MNLRQRALELLAKTETGLRSLVSQAATDGDYVAVVELAEWATIVAGLAAQRRPATSPASAAAAVPKKAGVGITSAGTLSRITKSKASVGKSAPEYPRFHRQGEQLVKVGYSRRLREEYRHKASWPVVEAVAAAVAAGGKGGRLFTPEQFLPIRESGARSDVPVYQVYVTLAWLRNLGLIKAHGRSGYTLAGEKELLNSIRLAWVGTKESD